MRTKTTLTLLSLVLSLGLVTLGGCKSKKSRKAKQAVSQADFTEEEEKLRQLEDEFKKQRELIKEKRSQLAKAKAELDRMAKTVSRDDKDAWEAYQKKLHEVTQLSQEVADLSKDFDNKWENWHRQTTAVLQKLQVVAETVKTADTSGDIAKRERIVALREKAIADREKELARREKELALREKALADRERDIAKREKDLAKGCASFAMPAISIPTAIPSGGGAVSKGEAERPIRRAEAIMASKGIRLGDLGPDAGKVYRQAKRALSKKEYYKAKLLGQQFLAVVKAIRIDRGFVGIKMSRINALYRRKEKKLSEAKRSKILSLLQKALSAYNDGNFRRANSHLNQVLSLL